MGNTHDTWLNQSNKISFKNYNVYRYGRTKPKLRGDSMIIYKKKLDPISYNIESIKPLKCDIAVISILDHKLSYERIFFVSLYKPPDIKFKVNHWRDFFRKIESITLSSQVFILGNFNVQNKTWDSTTLLMISCVNPCLKPSFSF